MDRLTELTLALQLLFIFKVLFFARVGHVEQVESGDYKLCPHGIKLIDFVPPFLSSAINSMNEIRHFIGSI